MSYLIKAFLEAEAFLLPPFASNDTGEFKLAGSGRHKTNSSF